MIMKSEVLWLRIAFLNLLSMTCKLILDWGCHKPRRAEFDNSISTKEGWSGGVSNCSNHRPVLQRCLSRLPGRTPVLPRRVISLWLEESQQQLSTYYAIRSLEPHEDMVVMKLQYWAAMEGVKSGHQPQLATPRPPSPLGLQMTSCTPSSAIDKRRS